LSYLQRRELLTDLDLAYEHVQTPPHWADVDGDDMLAVARQHGPDGIISKRSTSLFRPGARTPDWIKLPLCRAR
jgi:bifunctional non-homologous end joining protein LigD